MHLRRVEGIFRLKKTKKLFSGIWITIYLFILFLHRFDTDLRSAHAGVDC